MIKVKKLKDSDAGFATENVMTRSGVNGGKVSQMFGALGFDWFKSKPVVTILRLDGVIGKVGVGAVGMSLSSLEPLINKAFNMDRVTAVCLIINSPGGSPVQSELIAKRIRQLSKERGIPVYSFVEDMAASGGYWLACAGNEIYASRSSIIGSIGVIFRGFGLSDLIKKLGIERRVYAQGNNKSVLDPFKSATDEDIELINNIQKDIHHNFIEYVKSRRKGQLTQDDDILFNGKFWSGLVARDYGLIDDIDDVYSFIQRKFGGDVKIEHIKKKLPWLKEKLGIFGSVPKKSARDFTDAMLESLESKSKYSRFDLF